MDAHTRRRNHGTHLRRSLGVSLALVAWCLPAAAAGPRFVVFSSAHVILDEALGMPASMAQPANCTTPRYGTLERASQGLLYKPSLAFWSVGRDEFACPGIFEGSMSAVELVAAEPQIVTRHTFDDAGGGSTPWTIVDPEARLHVGTAAALAGQRGAGVSSGLDAAYLDGLLSAIPVGPISGEGYQPTSGGQQVRLPRPGGGIGLTVTPSEDAIVMAWHTTRSAADARVRLRRVADAYQITLEDGLGRATTPVPLAPGEHRLRLDWWRPDPALGVFQGGCRLFVNGRAVAQLSWPTEVDEHTEPVAFRAGVATESPAPSFAFDIDEVYVARGRQPGGAFAQSDFEAGAPQEWSEEAVAPQITPAAAIHGNFGLEVPLAQPLRGVYRDTRPSQLAGLRMSFSLRSIDGLLPEVDMSGAVTVLAAQSEERGAATAAFRLQLRGTGPRFEFVARLDDGTELTLPWITPESTSHHLALQWLAASSPLAADGVLRVFSDGLLVGELTGLDNDRLRIETLRLGASAPSSVASTGGLAFDDLRAW